VRIPFFFCQYQLLIEEEPLSFEEQLEELRAFHGKFFPHGALSRGAEKPLDSVIMRPEKSRTLTAAAV
jgi:hypothetical protein